MESQTFFSAIPGEIIDWPAWGWWSAKILFYGVALLLVIYFCRFAFFRMSRNRE